MRLLEIGDVPLERIRAAVWPIVPPRQRVVSELFTPTFLLTAEVLRGLRLLPRVGPTVFTFADREGRERRVTLSPLAAAEYHVAVGKHFGPHGIFGLPIRPEPSSLRRLAEALFLAKLLGGRVLYVGYNGAQASVYDVSLELARAARDPTLERAIVDVRWNGGGDNTTYGPLIGALEHPRLDRPGRLVSLIGRATFSAAKDFIVELEQATDVTFVGEPSGGSPKNHGDAVQVKLPQAGLNVYIATTWVVRSPLGDHRVTVAPRLRVEPSSADFLAGRDPVLDAALSLPPAARAVDSNSTARMGSPTTEDHACAYCGRPAPRLDDPEILRWEGGAALYGIDASDLPPGSLVCPDCRPEEQEREAGAGD